MIDRASRIILIEPDDEARDLLARRLRAQDYVVDCAADGVTGAEMALAAPPSAVVSDLWMTGVSGVQLCRLLRSEPATAEVPVILRAERDDPKSRFWAQCAGAAGFVSKDRMGELVRHLQRVAAAPAEEDAFFMRFGAGSNDVRDRIARNLDDALFESVIAAEVRALAGALSFARLFDSLSQLLSRLFSYHWLSVATTTPINLAVHAHPKSAELADAHARRALRIGPAVCAVGVHDGDAVLLGEDSDAPVIIKDIPFGNSTIGRLAVSPSGDEVEATQIASLVARELGGALRMAALVEESQRLATTDALTKLPNRRAFVDAMRAELARADRCNSALSIILIDVDHFKAINDKRGHACGDAVLAALGETLLDQAREYDVVARWGGEEFVVALPNANQEGSLSAAERLRLAIANAKITDPINGEPVHITASLGVTTRVHSDILDGMLERADRAMYAAKMNGRNAVYVVDGGENSEPRKSDFVPDESTDRKRRSDSPLRLVG